MHKFNQRLALGILHLNGVQLTSDQQLLMIDINKEYELIRQKKSKLSAHQRSEVVYCAESHKRNYDQHETQKNGAGS